MKEASAGDHGHCAPLATHVFLRGAEVIGAVALFAPTLTFWAHSSKLSKREAIYLAQTARQMGIDRAPDFLTACSPDSPYHHLMPSLGFRRLGNADYFEVAK